MSADRHPVSELIARYAAVFSLAWDARHELAGPARLADERAFLPHALSLQETPVHPAPRRFAFAIMALFVIALIWAIVGKVDIVAVAPGRIVVSEGTKLVQPLERSVVKRVLVRDGDHVRVGQPLIELDPTFASADKKVTVEVAKAAESDALRARGIFDAMSAGSTSPRPEFPSEWNVDDVNAARSQLEIEWGDISAKIAKFTSEADRRNAEIVTAKEVISKIEMTLPILRQRERDLDGLARDGYAAEHVAQDKARERLELERDLSTQRARLAEAAAALRETVIARAAYIAETKRSMSDREGQARLKLQQAKQDRSKAEQRERLTVLRAAVDGSVQQLAVHTEGGVVTEAQTLMVVVPDSAEVTAEVMLENKDIGFVAVGQIAEIKVEAFPSTRYGTVAARVVRVGADAVADERKVAQFPVTLALLKTEIAVEGRAIRLQPGMNLSAEVKTGNRSIIEFLLSPVYTAVREAGRER